TKFLVGRERPRVHFGSPHGNDDFVSFYSGHTSWVFSLAVASGTVAQIRGYRLAPGVWARGPRLAPATRYPRLGPDQHYFSDVLTGAIIGTAIGFVVPWLHRGSGGGGAAVPVAWSFRF